jgi:hypothetical protein
MVWLFQDRYKYHETIRLYKIIKKINKKTTKINKKTKNIKKVI